MRIKKAEPKDIYECVRLGDIKEFEMSGGSIPDEEYFRDSLRKGLFFVAEENSKILGFMVGFKLTSKLVYLDLLTVNKNFRRRGIGQKLIGRFKDELKKQKVEEYFLVVPLFNEKTLSFYKKLGLNEGEEYKLFHEKFN